MKKQLVMLGIVVLLLSVGLFSPIVKGEKNLIIECPSKAYEGDGFVVIVRYDDHRFASDVKVTFNRKSLYTDWDGQVVFTAPDPQVDCGMYDIMAEGVGYKTIFCEIWIYRKYPLYIELMTFNPQPQTQFMICVRDSREYYPYKYGEPVSGATVEFEGQIDTSSVYGYCTFKAPVSEGIYNLTAKHPDYKENSLDIKIIQETDKTSGFELITENFEKIVL